MFYEIEHSLGTDTLNMWEGEDFAFPAHIHDSFELIAVRHGKMRVGINSHTYCVGEGEAVLVFPEQVHYLESESGCSHLLWIFSPDNVRSFSRFAFSHFPMSNLFHPSDALFEKLLSLKNDRRPLHIKSVLYTLIDEFDQHATYMQRDPEKENLLLQIFDFVASHYSENCSLGDLSSMTSYHYAYLSRYFTERVGMSFTQYVNSYRVSQSCTKLLETSDSVTSIGLDCGFDSLRSYHRNFKKHVGCTPTEYRLSKI